MCSKVNQTRKSVLVVFGTRPEAIKMAPIVKELKVRNILQVHVCVTGQHHQMLDQVLEAFNVEPDYNFSIMKDKQDLFYITETILSCMKELLTNIKPDIVLVHGDTSTAFATALACFYLKIPVGHVEAGLRTNNIYSPYPEEFNRQSVGLVAMLHFAPTMEAKKNLIDEGKNEDTVFVTGNTVIDALKTTVRDNYNHELLEWAMDSKLILITAHRRENLGKPMDNMFSAICRVLKTFPKVKAIYPIHLNPEIRLKAQHYLKDCKNIKIVEPLDVTVFHNLLKRSYLILTDSGGIQEEASFLKKPVLVMRETTERPEGLNAGTLKLVGSNEEKIYLACEELLTDNQLYIKMSSAENPYGDGNAVKKIADILELYLNQK